MATALAIASAIEALLTSGNLLLLSPSNTVLTARVFGTGLDFIIREEAENVALEGSFRATSLGAVTFTLPSF